MAGGESTALGGAMGAALVLVAAAADAAGSRDFGGCRGGGGGRAAGGCGATGGVGPRRRGPTATAAPGVGRIVGRGLAVAAARGGALGRAISSAARVFRGNSPDGARGFRNGDARAFGVHVPADAQRCRR